MTTITATPDAIAELLKAKATTENELRKMRRVNSAFKAGRREFLRRGFSPADYQKFADTTIAARATEDLYKATRAEQDAASHDDAEDSGQGDDPAEDMTGAASEYFPEPVAPIVAVDMDELTDPNDFIPIVDIPYLHALADAQ